MPIRIQQGPGAEQAATDPAATAPDAQHTPFIHCVERTRAGEPFPVAVRVGYDAEHPDEPEHHIAWLQLWSGDQLLAEARFAPGLLGGAGHPMVTFNLVPTTGVLELTALAYCSRHGLWQGPSRRVDVDAPPDDDEE